MTRLFAKVAAGLAATASLVAGAPSVGAQPAVGSIEVPIVVPRPFDIPIWQLPPLPFPLEWEFHLPPAKAPQYGDPCLPEQVYDVHDRRLVCVYAGAPSPRWVFVSPEALNPDGTLNLDYPAG